MPWECDQRDALKKLIQPKDLCGNAPLQRGKTCCEGSRARPPTSLHCALAQVAARTVAGILGRKSFSLKRMAAKNVEKLLVETNIFLEDIGLGKHNHSLWGR